MDKHYLYKITKKGSGEQYIGVSNNPLKRWMEHVDADSRVGHSLQHHGIESFSFSFIAVFPSRQDAETAEMEWIQRENPELNVSHREDVVAPEFPGLPPGGNQRRQQRVVSQRPTPLKIDNEKLQDNEFFKILHEEDAKILVYVKGTDKVEKIPRRINARDLIVLAPLEWWCSLVGVAQHATLTVKHILPIASSMIQIAQQNTVHQNIENLDSVEGRKKRVIEIVQKLLSLRIDITGHSGSMETVMEALLYNYPRLSTVTTYGFRIVSPGNGIHIAATSQQFKSFLIKSRWSSITDIKTVLLSHPAITSAPKVVYFRPRHARAIHISEAVLEDAGFSTVEPREQGATP